MAFCHTRLELKQHNKEQFYQCFWSRPPWRLDTGSTGFQSLAQKIALQKEKNCQNILYITEFKVSKLKNERKKMQVNGALKKASLKVAMGLPSTAGYSAYIALLL